MNPTPESKGRDVSAEIDEIAQTLQIVLRQMGESFDVQREVNVSINNTMAECLKVITSLEERISSLEDRVATLEDGHRLILP